MNLNVFIRNFTNRFVVLMGKRTPMNATLIARVFANSIRNCIREKTVIDLFLFVDAKYKYTFTNFNFPFYWYSTSGVHVACEGACPCPCNCSSAGYNPVCTHATLLYLLHYHSLISKSHQLLIVSAISQQLLYFFSQVCGTDGITYTSECEMSCKYCYYYLSMLDSILNLDLILNLELPSNSPFKQLN